MNKHAITLGHSPDPDDAFMFYGLARGLVPDNGFQFTHQLLDIQTLNEKARRGELDVTAISIHAYAYICDQYAMLPSGASMGDGYGPMLVAKTKMDRATLRRKRIAIPGKLTSAFLAMQLYLDASEKELDLVVVPFDQIFEAVHKGTADVGLIIHEGQLTHQKEGFSVCVDLGIWWNEQNEGLPLPLGGNVIHKRIAPADRKIISDTIHHSIQYGLDHRDEAVRYALKFGRGLDQPLADRFVGMYVNHWTLDYGDKGRESIRRFLKQGFEKGLIAHLPELEFVS